MGHRWLSIERVMKVSSSVERADFLLVYPNPVLIAAEIRDGKLLPARNKGRNPTMQYQTAADLKYAQNQTENPVRFMPIRRPAPIDGEPEDLWLTIGRIAECHIMINDYTISKRHARILVDMEQGRFVIKEEGSTNGTWVNGQRLGKAESCILSSGDSVRFGRHIFTFFKARGFYEFLKTMPPASS
jgi:pSer/pThr/pTyr-binding forkhead associated (FHA) protein